MHKLADFIKYYSYFSYPTFREYVIFSNGLGVNSFGRIHRQKRYTYGIIVIPNKQLMYYFNQSYDKAIVRQEYVENRFSKYHSDDSSNDHGVYDINNDSNNTIYTTDYEFVIMY